MSARDKICSDIYPNDQTLVEIYTVVLNFGLDTCQIKLRFVQVKVHGQRHMSDVVIS